MRSAFLVQNINESKHFSNLEKIFLEDYMVLINEVDGGNSAEKVNYFYCINFSENDQSNIDWFSKAWFVDYKGRDLSDIEGISMGQVMHPTLFITLNMAYRAFLCMRFWLEKFEVIYMGRDCHPIFQRIAHYYGGRVKFINSEFKFDPILSSCSERTFKIPSKRKIILFLCFVQSLFSKFYKNKVIFINDWTYSSSVKKRKDFLMVNYGKNIFKSVFFSSSINNFILSNKIISNEISDNIFSRIKLKKINWDGNLIRYLISHIESNYQRNQEFFSFTIASYRDLILRYSPSKIVFPAEIYEPYVIGAFICRLNNVEAWLSLDGFIATPSRKDFLQYSFEGGSLMSGVIAAGKSNYDYFNDGRFKQLKLVTVEPPLVRNIYINYLNTCNLKFDILIMTMTPSDCRLSGFYGGRLRSMVDMLIAANECGFTKIAVKLKNVSEKLIVNCAISISGVDPNLITILSGHGAEAIQKSKLVLGGMSSALAEAKFMDRPYIVYEPDWNGYSNLDIELSKIVDGNLVARNKKKLTRLLKIGKSSINASNEYIFSGRRLEDIEF